MTRSVALTVIGGIAFGTRTDLNAELADLSRLNKDINHRIEYRSDKFTTGFAEWWEVADKYGDCEDYALKKLQVLYQQGVRIEDLILATAYVETGEYHTVLLVNINGRFAVMDNRSDVAYWIEDSCYKWMMRQQIGGSRTWIKM